MRANAAIYSNGINRTTQMVSDLTLKTQEILDSVQQDPNNQNAHVPNGQLEMYQSASAPFFETGIADTKNKNESLNLQLTPNKNKLLQTRQTTQSKQTTKKKSVKKKKKKKKLKSAVMAHTSSSTLKMQAKRGGVETKKNHQVV